MKPEEKKYYTVEVKWAGSLFFFIWTETDKEDGVVLDENGQIAVFQFMDCLFQYAHSQSIILEKQEPAKFDFDALVNWVENVEMEIDCIDFLNNWNMLGDIGWSLGIKFEGYNRDPLTDLIYDKLFYGNNLFTKPEEEYYYPEWTRKERKRLGVILQDGLRLFKSNYAIKRCDYD